MEKIAPKFVHGCKGCIHLDTVFIAGKWRDLYWCKDDLNGVLGGCILSRRSSDPSDYDSWPLSTWESQRNNVLRRLQSDGTCKEDNNLTASVLYPSIEYAYGCILLLKHNES